MVATQLKTLMAVNTPTSMDSTLKMPASRADWPDTNMWCPHTKKPTKAMPRLE